MILTVLVGIIFLIPSGVEGQEFPFGLPETPDSTRATVFRVNGDGNVARYRVQEQLVGVNFPNDAVGETRAIVGQVVVGAKGTIERDLSRITITLASLNSGSRRRDRYIRENTLLTPHYSEMLLLPTEIRGLPVPVPASGEHAFLLLADVVLKGNRHPSTWEVTATFEEDQVHGIALAEFTFEELGLEKPRVGILLGVSDEIRLEYEFVLDRPSGVLSQK